MYRINIFFLPWTFKMYWEFSMNFDRSRQHAKFALNYLKDSLIRLWVWMKGKVIQTAIKLWSLLVSIVILSGDVYVRMHASVKKVAYSFLRTSSSKQGSRPWILIEQDKMSACIRGIRLSPNRISNSTKHFACSHAEIENEDHICYLTHQAVCWHRANQS